MRAGRSAIGASRPFRCAQVRVPQLNRQRPFSLAGGTGLRAPHLPFVIPVKIGLSAYPPPAGRLPPATCVGEGFTKVQTYIASGNVVFAAKQPASTVKALLEKRLHAYAGNPIGVIVRTADEMMSVLESNPFSKAPPNWTVAIILEDAPPVNRLATLQDQKDEEVR
jgi:hypothetical protein